VQIVLGSRCSLSVAGELIVDGALIFFLELRVEDHDFRRGLNFQQVGQPMIDVLQHEGVPVPNRDYIATQGHAACDFLGRDGSFADATQFVQRSTIWDAHQSADFTIAAIVTYCPQFESTSNDQAQQTYQKSMTNLQAVQGDLQGINRDLQDISDGLHGGS